MSGGVTIFILNRLSSGADTGGSSPLMIMIFYEFVDLIYLTGYIYIFIYIYTN